MGGCIFDLDGTLTNTLESLTYSVNLTLQEMGLPAITMDQCRRFVGDGARKLMERTLRTCGEEGLSRLEEGLKIYGRIFHDNCTYHVTPYDGITEMLRELKAMDIRLAVLSNKPHLQAVDVVRQIFGEGVFDFVQGQSEELPRKPDPAGVLYLLDKLGVNKEDCVYVGDSEVDVATARAAGVTELAATWGFRSRQALEEAGAGVLIDRPEELVDFLRSRGMDKEKKDYESMRDTERERREDKRMYEYDEECLQVFLDKQGQLFDEPIAETLEEAEAFLEDCMAIVVDSIQEVSNYFQEEGVDVDGMSLEELEEASEVFALPSGKYLIVEG